MDGTSPKEGVGKESSLDLKRLCRALVEMLLQDAKARMAVLPPGRLRRARHRAKRLALRTMGGQVGMQGCGCHDGRIPDGGHCAEEEGAGWRETGGWWLTAEVPSTHIAVAIAQEDES